MALACLVPLPAWGQVSISFAWQANTEPDLAGYRLFARLENEDYAYSDPIWEGAETTCTIEIAAQDLPWHFVLRAFDTEGFESVDSDEVCYGCDPQIQDNCPDDPDKVEPGICGCGVPDNDSDADGVSDCSDGCPDDSDKVEPGLCGCGVPDTDSDGDGVLDCDDGCPHDIDKVFPGMCGCGRSDVDTDEDGTFDCDDADDDNDGIDDAAEANGPNQGDANQDGISDSLQCNVSCLVVDTVSDYIVIESPEGTCVSGFRPVTTLDPDDFPAAVAFIYGLYAFEIHGVAPGYDVGITMTLPGGAAPDTYYAYGPSPDNPNDHWYPFLDDGETGAVLDNNVIVIYFADTLRGDNVQPGDGRVVTLGAPGFVSDSTEKITNPGYEAGEDDEDVNHGCLIQCLVQHLN